MTGDEARRALADSPEVKAYLATRNTAVYIVRPDGHIVWASPSMAAVMGHAPEDLVGRNGWDVLVPPEEMPHVAAFRAALADGDGTLWSPLRIPGDKRDWFRIDTMLRGDAIVCAFRRESDPIMRHRHFFMRPRPVGPANREPHRA